MREFEWTQKLKCIVEADGTIDWDSIYKLSCLEKYPEYVEEEEE